MVALNALKLATILTLATSVLASPHGGDKAWRGHSIKSFATGTAPHSHYPTAYPSSIYASGTGTAPVPTSTCDDVADTDGLLARRYEGVRQRNAKEAHWRGGKGHSKHWRPTGSGAAASTGFAWPTGTGGVQPTGTGVW
ncbi:hypothetical protein B0A48_03354 [Cryoendolithus antarcticus]|uniref:Uncharacterized protein n=1 Tax=Cryoendolithus antarcticus TaxID=1507870 RepID=A0A1V8TJS7_9PEZI|nr:hypothetical protein B0A48_03354 [Cryoendolithus antarcticus]